MENHFSGKTNSFNFAATIRATVGERQTAVAAIHKIVGLLGRNFLTAFCGVEVERLEHRTVVFLKRGGFQNAADNAEEPIPQAHFLRVEISCALVGLGGQFFTHGSMFLLFGVYSSLL